VDGALIRPTRLGYSEAVAQLQERSIMEGQMTIDAETERRAEIMRAEIMETFNKRPAARATDPETSHEAAASVKRVTAKQESVLQILRRYGALTDEEIRNYHRALKYEYQSDSGLRTRRAELVRMGKVARTDEVRLTTGGRKTIVWKAL
jgi:hypothetical protein